MRLKSDIMDELKGYGLDEELVKEIATDAHWRNWDFGD